MTAPNQLREELVPAIEQEWPANMSVEDQIQKLADFILAKYPKEIKGGAVETAISILSKIEERDKKLVEDFIRNYRKTHRDLRFGQDLWNKMNAKGKWEAPEANALFYIEDDELATLLSNNKDD